MSEHCCVGKETIGQTTVRSILGRKLARRSVACYCVSRRWPREVYTGSDTTRQSQDLVRQFGRSYLLVFEMCFGEELYGSERDDAIYSGRRSYGARPRASARLRGRREVVLPGRVNCSRRPETYPSFRNPVRNVWSFEARRVSRTLPEASKVLQ